MRCKNCNVQFMNLFEWIPVIENWSYEYTEYRKYTCPYCGYYNIEERERFEALLKG